MFHIVADYTRIKPSTLNIQAGNKGTMICDSNGDTRWYYNNVHTKPISLKTIMVIKLVLLKHGGVYYCYGLYNHKSMHFLAKAILNVHGEFHTLIYH